MDARNVYGYDYDDAARTASIYKIDGVTNVKSNLVSNVESSIGRVVDMQAGPDGGLYVLGDKRFARVDTTTGAVTVLAGNGSAPTSTVLTGSNPLTQALPQGLTGFEITSTGVFAFRQVTNISTLDDSRWACYLLNGTWTDGEAVGGTPAPVHTRYDNVPVIAADGAEYAIGDQNMLYRLAPGSSTVIAGNGTEAAPVAGPARNSSLGWVQGITVDANGVVYVLTNYGSGGTDIAAVWRVSADGTFDEVARFAGDVLTDIEAGPNGALFVADQPQGVIYKLTQAAS